MIHDLSKKRYILFFAVYPRFWPKAPKTLEVFWEERHKGVSCYVSEVMFGPEDGAAGCWEIRSLSAPSPDCGEGREAGG